LSVGSDVDLRRVVQRFVRAETVRLDLAWVEKLRKDFLTLMGNLPRVKDYKEAHVLRDAFNIYRKNFEKLFFENFLNHDLKYGHPGLGESDAKYYDNKLRGPAWAFSTELSVPIGYADDGYHTETGLFARYQAEYPKWKARVMRKALVFWKAMKEFLDYYRDDRSSEERGISVKVPTVENTELEGFKLIMKGFEPGDEHHEAELAMLKEGLRHYRQRASTVAPILLRKQLPVIVEFATTLDKGGVYTHDGTITFYASSIRSAGGSKWVAHVMAHEMGHHLWHTYLGKDAQDFWYATIRGDYGKLDLRELIAKWPEGAWAFEMPEILGDKDPILALQIQAITHDPSYSHGHGLEKKEEFQKLLDDGQTSITVPTTPITGYANKSPEEAFSETLGLLIAHGPLALHERVRFWLETVLPGDVKIANRVLARFLARQADSQVGAQKFGRFNVQFLQQHAKFVPRIGELLLDAERQIAAAGFPIPHEIQVLVTGRGIAHALAVYAAVVPPTIKIAPKAYGRGDLGNTLIHELGHYFHDKVVPNGFRNGAVASRYRWAIEQKPTGVGNNLDAAKLKVKTLEAEMDELRKDLYKFPRKGAVLEWVHDWFGKKYPAKGTVLGRGNTRLLGRGAWDVDVRLMDSPFLTFIREHNMYPSGVIPVHVAKLVEPDPVIAAKLAELGEELSKANSAWSAITQDKDQSHDNTYKELFHDWLPTTYSRKNNHEWFAEMFTTCVLGHLKPEPAAWLKSIIETGKAPESLVAHPS
jgi:hypothetical protein